MGQVQIRYDRASAMAELVSDLQALRLMINLYLQVKVETKPWKIQVIILSFWRFAQACQQ